MVRLMKVQPESVSDSPYEESGMQVYSADDGILQKAENKMEQNWSIEQTYSLIETECLKLWKENIRTLKQDKQAYDTQSIHCIKEHLDLWVAKDE